MAVDYISIGKNIRKHRLALDLTQEKLAERAGIETTNMSHIERAATKVSLPTLVNIANALDVSLDDLAYDSLIKSTHVSVKLIDDLLADCSPSEIAAFAEILKTVKDVMRKKNV